jgi:HPt (histidine-containing phosphotransfer) domain-containing protein
MKYAAGDRAVALEVLALFEAQAPEWLDALRAAQDVKNFSETAHAVKGAARGIGARRLADVAALAEANTDDARLAALLADIETAVRSTLAAIAALEGDENGADWENSAFV